MAPEFTFVPPGPMFVPPTFALLEPGPPPALEFVELAPPADADADAGADFRDGVLSGLGEALDDFFGAFDVALAVAVLFAHLVPVGVGEGLAEAVAVGLVPALADPEPGTGWEVWMLGLTGGLAAVLAEALALPELAGAEVTTGLLVWGEVLAEATADAAAEVHDAAGAGCWFAVAVPWPPAPALAAPAAAWPSVPCPAVVPAPSPLALCPDSTEELSWTMACRSGGTAAATPMANTAQATASAGRSMTSRMSQPVHHPARRRDDRARDLADRAVGGPGASGANVAIAAPPDLILARIRSRPSERGST